MLEWLFGSKKKTYPVLASEMLQPVENKIGTTEAKRIYREWMLKIGYLDKQEVGDHVGYLADDIRSTEEYLKEEVERWKAESKDEAAELKQEIKELKARIKACKDSTEKTTLEEELADAQEDLASSNESFLIEAQQALAAFKADKREFLIDYINSQVHGRDWETRQ